MCVIRPFFCCNYIPDGGYIWITSASPSLSHYRALAVFTSFIRYNKNSCMVCFSCVSSIGLKCSDKMLRCNCTVGGSFWFEEFSSFSFTCASLYCVDAVTISTPSEKNKVSTGWNDGAVRSLPVPSHCVMLGSVVFALACCEWDWGGGGDGEWLDVCALRRRGAHPEGPSGNAVVSAMPCCLVAIFTSVPFRAVPNTLETFLMVLLRVVLSFFKVCSAEYLRDRLWWLKNMSTRAARIH